MRLVREIEFDEMEQEQPRRSRRKPRITEEVAEAPDGAVEETPVATLEAVSVEASPSDEAIVAEEDESNARSASVDLRSLEALLFATQHPLTAGRLAEVLGLDSTKPLRTAIRDLNAAYTETGRSFRIEQVAGGYQMLTLPEFGDLLRQMHQKEVDAKLTKAGMETLAIIAYKQPILRADVEAVRGVACGETIRNLMEKHLVKIAGRAEIPGRPILYGTTKRFLEVFGLNNLKDLPQPEGATPNGASVALVSRIEPVAAVDEVQPTQAE